MLGRGANDDSLDSYPWVCVAMLSDTTGMVGGETVIETGTGSYKGVSC